MKTGLATLEASSQAHDSPADWKRSYVWRLAVTDFLVLVWVIFGVQIAWFGFDSAQASGQGSMSSIAISYTAISIFTLVAWMSILHVYGTRESRVIGTGTQEYRLIVDGGLRLFGLIAIFAFLLKVDFARGYILVALPLGLVVLVFARWMWRQWLKQKRAEGSYSYSVLLVGSKESASHIARELKRRPEAGYRVVGACVPGATAGQRLTGTDIPVLGRIEDVTIALQSSGSDTVVISSADELPPERVRELSWGLEPGRQHLVVAPSLIDIGGPRIHTRPVSGLPLIHVETPRYDGRTRFTKRAFDLLLSLLIVIALSPVFLVLIVLVKMTSRGPVFYRQERIGRNGEPFDMLKFRSMVVDADSMLPELLRAQGSEDVPLFKVENDPRITRIGKVLRKYSLDELPQILNVIMGDMSLVGPRPQREGEVALYDKKARRRLIVQPGMTGLWQVSGRSSLSWEDAIRLDLYYVENWSLTGDIVILFRTVRAVVAPGSDAH